MTTDDIWGCLRGYDSLEIIIPARSIPDGSTVRKTNGTQNHTIASSVVIYDEKGKRKDVKIGDDVRVLHGPRGSINLISTNKKLVWTLTVEDFILAVEDTSQ